MAQKVTVTVEPIRVEDAIKLFLDFKIANDSRAGTMKMYGTDMKRLREVAGNVYTTQLKPDHMSRVLRYHADKGNGQGARNNTTTHLRQFCEWARINGYMSPFEALDPMRGFRRKSYEAEQPPPIAFEEWPTLFDIADKRHPLHRAYFALGLYLMARGPSEIGSLKLWDLSRSSLGWTAAVTRVKTRRAADPMEMPTELCIELSRWLTFYNKWTIEHFGEPLKRDWFLIPRMRSAAAPGTSAGQNIREGTLYPHLRRHPASFSLITYPTLKEYGFPVDDPTTGKKNRWGGTHTLRKSGARAWFDELCEAEGSRDRALRIVKEQLGHKSITMTEHYLGLDVDRWQRNKILRGQYMFRANDPAYQATTGAVPLRPVVDDAPDVVESALEDLPEWIRGVA